MAIFKIHIVIEGDIVSFEVVPGGIIDLLLGYNVGYMDRHYHACTKELFIYGVILFTNRSNNPPPQPLITLYTQQHYNTLKDNKDDNTGFKIGKFFLHHHFLSR